MKKILLLIPIVLLSCKKDVEVSETVLLDSVATETTLPPPPPAVDSAAIRDSMVNNAPATKEVLRTGVMRDVKGNQIIRTADASQLPFSLGEEFTEEGQELVLKLKNYSKNTLSAIVTPKNTDMNIRINSVLSGNEAIGGPYGREVTETIPAGSEVTLVIGRSNMASNSSVGSFTVSID